MKLAFLVWAVDWFSTASFFSVLDLIGLTVLALLAFGLFPITVTEGDIDNAYFEWWIEKLKTRAFKVIYSILFSVALLGSIAESLIPDNKNTIYLMVGAYFTSEAIDDCNKVDTSCNKIKTILERKISKAIEDIDAEDAKAAVEKAADKAAEKVAENVKKD